MRYLITGGTGSLGKALIRTLLKHGEKVAIVSRDEGKQAFFKKNFPEVECYIGDVKDLERMKEVIQLSRPDMVIHAAALKRIDDMEHAPLECIKTNVVGSENVCKAILNYAQHGHSISGILVSTDKSCLPVNVYGSSKFTAERVFSHFDYQATKMNLKCKFASVRYGNVIASRGSFIPLWIEMVKNDEVVTITAPECTRYLFTLQDAVSTVLTATMNMTGGEVWVPHLKSFAISTVLEVVAKMNGKDMNSVKTNEIGLRPGEKLHEDMVSNVEAVQSELISVPAYPGGYNNTLKMQKIHSKTSLRNESQKAFNNSPSFNVFNGKAMDSQTSVYIGAKEGKHREDLKELIKRGLSEL